MYVTHLSKKKKKINCKDFITDYVNTGNSLSNVPKISRHNKTMMLHILL